MKLGLDVFLENESMKYSGMKIGLLTNLTGVNQNLESTVDLFAMHPCLQLTALYGPEHGIRGEANEGEWIDSSIDSYTGLPVHSLYNKDKNPNEQMLNDVDVVFCDLQDIGSRYYTFIYTMANVMMLCKKQGKQFIVLDRPNPINGESLEGNLVEPKFASFVGQFPIPVRHGLTIGELAGLFNEEFGIYCELVVIPMEGWTRNMYFDDTKLFWISPTPNATNLTMCLLYPGTCLIEGTNVSEGRGTTKPFEVIGAPFIDGRKLSNALTAYELPGIRFRPTVFRPQYSKFAGEVCEGIQLHISDRKLFQPFVTGITILKVLKDHYSNQVEFIRSEEFNNHYFLDLLAGTDLLRLQLTQGNIASFMARLSEETLAFENLRKRYLLY